MSWPKILPELKPEKNKRSDLFMELWHMELSKQKKYGLIERFNHKFPVKNSQKDFKKTIEVGAGLGEHLRYEVLNTEQKRNYWCIEFRQNMAKAIK